MKRSHKSKDFKVAVIKYYLEVSPNFKQVSLIFSCSCQSLMRWVKQYKTEGSVFKKIRKPVSYKITKKHIFFIKNILKKEKQITINKLYRKLIKKFSTFEISLSHIYRVVKDINYSLKQVKFQHIPETRYNEKINIEEIKKNFMIICVEISQKILFALMKLL